MPNNKINKHRKNMADLVWSIANNLAGLYMTPEEAR